MDLIAQNAAEAIISSLILGPAIFGVAWIAMRVLPPGKAALRFAVWLSALVSIALLPLLQIALHVTASSAGFANAGHSVIVLPPHWAAYLLWTWAAIAAVGLSRVIAGLWHLHRVRSASSVVAPAQLISGVREAVFRAAQARAFELRASDQIQVPVAIGFFRPAVVVPSYLLDELSPVQLGQILMHETTHLLRYDDWTNLLQKIAQAVFFFHPAVWWLESKLTLEREMACDEAVVAHTSDARSYAECLALLAERSLLRRGLVLVQTAVSRLRHTSLRVRELLAPEQKKTVRAWGTFVAVAGVLACSAVLVQAPDLVSFQNRTTTLGENGPEATVGTSVPNVPREKRERVRPQVLPAALKHNEILRPQSEQGVRAKATQNRVAEHVVVARSHPAVERNPQVVLASQDLTSPENMQSVPVVVTTVIVESGAASGVPEQVWGTWRVTVYYPTAEKKVTGTSKQT